MGTSMAMIILNGDNHIDKHVSIAMTEQQNKCVKQTKNIM